MLNSLASADLRLLAGEVDRFFASEMSWPENEALEVNNVFMMSFPPGTPSRVSSSVIMGSRRPFREEGEGGEKKWPAFYSVPLDDRLKRSARRLPVAFSPCSRMVDWTTETRLEKFGCVLKKARSSPLMVRRRSRNVA